jgi:hypothetical protein
MDEVDKRKILGPNGRAKINKTKMRKSQRL